MLPPFCILCFIRYKIVPRFRNESCTLSCGNSDKVYHYLLENADDKWSVLSAAGAGGSSLQSDVKTSNTAYKEAKRVHDRILQEKAGKGYQIAQATANGDAAISD
jgi:hypothetical protein